MILVLIITKGRFRYNPLPSVTTALVSIDGYNGGTGAFPSNSVDNVTVNGMTT